MIPFCRTPDEGRRVVAELAAPLFDERHPAVLSLVADVIARARACGRKIGICGQAPSDYPEFTRFLVCQGIGSISLNPDAVVRGVETIAAAEQESVITVAAAGRLLHSTPSSLAPAAAPDEIRRA
jgi:pyruvate, water dikinase